MALLAAVLLLSSFVHPESRMHVVRDVVYAAPLTLDLYEPAGAKTPRLRPLFLAIHGGGWTRGTKRNENIVQLCEELAARGYVCASIEYRLTGNRKDAIDDAERALRWLVANAKTYRIDPARIAIGGSSAGAITALYVAYERKNRNVRAVLCWAGGLEGDEQIVTKGGPPLFVIHGTVDRSIPVAEARALIARARAAGVPQESWICEGVGHNAPLDRLPLGVSLYDRLAHFLFRSLDLSRLATASPKRLEAPRTSADAISCPKEAPRPLRVLFIGNSLTYANDLPKLVEDLAAADGRPLETGVVAFPDFALEDHLRDGRAARALSGGRWDVVVLQQGPSALESSRSALVRDTEAFATLIRKHTTAKIALLTVWPSRSRIRDFPRVIESYRLAAQAAGGLLIPAGAEWDRALREHPQTALYGDDGFHPSKLGSQLAARAVYRVLAEELR